MTEHRVSLEALAAQLADGSHAIFSPSASAMWTHCSGSLIPNALAADDVGVDAATGTVAHGIGELWLKTKRKPRHLIGTTERIVEGKHTFDVEIDEEMLDYVRKYVDWCDMLPGSHYVEQRVHFAHLTPIPKQGGTCDHAACAPGSLVITDLKYGKGEMVFARDNTQALLYAIGFFHEWDWLYDFQDITIRICQPRLDHFDEWQITREKLLSYEPWFKDRAHAAWKLNAPRAASEKGCRWCRVKNDCAAFAVMQAELMEGVFDDLTKEVTVEKVEDLKARLNADHFVDALDVMRLSNAQIGVLLKYRSMAESWWGSLAKEATRRAADGQDIPGQKLVESRSRRRFVNMSKAAPRLISLGCKSDDVYRVSFPTPAEAERMLKKVGYRTKDISPLLEPLVVKPAGLPTLAPLTDTRPAITDLTGIVFTDMTDEDSNREPEDI